jgi:AraC family transcriptional regulator
MSLANRALFTIERNLRAELSLAGIAETCNVSRYHLAHAFGETTGMPVMGYVRSRRLSEAAKRLADGADNILDLALEYGYASHEAFGRAFRSQFGTTPEAVRRDGVGKLPLTAPVSVGEGTRKKVAPHRIVEAPAFAFVGLAAQIPFGGTHTIPAQWERFMQNYYSGIDDKADDIPWGVNASLDEDGNFTYVTAAKVKRAAAAPKDLTIVRTYARRYAVFRHDDHVYTLPQTYMSIWNDWTPDTGVADAPSLEQHLPTFDTRTGYGGVELWIPLT